MGSKSRRSIDRDDEKVTYETVSNDTELEGPNFRCISIIARNAQRVKKSNISHI